MENQVKETDCFNVNGLILLIGAVFGGLIATVVSGTVTGVIIGVVVALIFAIFFINVLLPFKESDR